MSKFDHCTRPELQTLQQVMAAIGASLVDQDGSGETLSAVTFQIETSPEDEVRIHLQDWGPEYGGLSLDLFMYPEDVLRDATPREMASTIARWLRETAAKIEGAA